MARAGSPQSQGSRRRRGTGSTQASRWGLSSPISSAKSALPPPWLGFQVHAHFSTWASRSTAPGWGHEPGAQPGAWRVTDTRRSEAGQEGQRGCVFSNDVRKCHEARVVLARGQSAPTGIGRVEATPPYAPCSSNPGTKESPRRCCTCCYCLRAPFRRPASHTPRPPNQGVAPRCYWRSRSSGPHPGRRRRDEQGAWRQERQGEKAESRSLGSRHTPEPSPAPGFRAERLGAEAPGNRLEPGPSRESGRGRRSQETRGGGGGGPVTPAPSKAPPTPAVRRLGTLSPLLPALDYKMGFLMGGGLRMNLGRRDYHCSLASKTTPLPHPCLSLPSCSQRSGKFRGPHGAS